MIFLSENKILSEWTEVFFFNMEDAVTATRYYLSTRHTNFLMGFGVFAQLKNKLSYLPKSELGPEIGDQLIKYAGSCYVLTEKINPEEIIPFSKLSYEQIGELYGEKQ